MSSPARTVFHWVLFLAAFGGAIGLQTRIIDKRKNEPNPYYDTLYLPSSEYVRTITVGYDQFAADYFWLRAIQTFGATFANRDNLGQLQRYFDVVTDLDPAFVDVYSFANMAIGEEAGLWEPGLAMLDKGMEMNPRRYRLPFEAAFFSYWTMNDPERALYYVRMALKAPDCPGYVGGWLGYFDAKMGRYQAALEHYFLEYARHYNAGDADLAELRLVTLRRSIDGWYRAVLREKAIAGRKPDGSYPSVEELETAGAFGDAEMPDWSRLGPFLETLKADGTPLPSEREELLALLERFVRRGWDRMPSNPASYNRFFMGYRIWPGQEPTAPDPADPEKAIDNSKFAISELEIAKVLHDQISVGSKLLRQVASEHMHWEEGECPPEVRQSWDLTFASKYAEPWGGEWVWNDEYCAYFPSTHPEILTEYSHAPQL